MEIFVNKINQSFIFNKYKELTLLLNKGETNASNYYK